MIKWNKSAKLHDMSIDDLKIYFKKFPQSNKNIIITCNNCGNNIKKGFAHIKNTNFCDKKCFNEWRSKNVRGKKHPRYNKKIVLCNNCGNKIEKKLSDIGKHNFCDKKCFGAWNSKRNISLEERKRVSAGLQGIPYDEWEAFASEQKYCPLFDDECRESNREKYGRRCFLSGKLESENITKNGDVWKLSVHHVDMDKRQGCDGVRWKLVPLCLEWHSVAHSDMWKARIIWLLDNVWN